MGIIKKEKINLWFPYLNVFFLTKEGICITLAALLDIQLNETYLSRISNQLHFLLVSTDPFLIDEATQVLEKLIRKKGALSTGIVESETKRALEWLQSKGKSLANE
ncbi:hypothetical protein AX774_g5085 [Zancudomyces culisetae]|uniref:Uncharacterized protein n=1 Tax=Zancudomyces culisetae TaxID=1213189 RepID=A0A1R1PKG8_ZANCU|nr:hypothetical protein AX774_g5085 [Zancudomyces culisetae]|eukprot:OMH81454.1 hypothetical protein AX774_g5085 [Zancudomyces culisetae]